MIEIPFDVRETYGTMGQVKVRATFDGVEYRGSLAPMGGGRHVLGVRKDIRTQIGKDVGNRVKITVEPDTVPRTVTVPPDLRRALSAHQAQDRFDGLSYTHRKEFVQWVEGAKRDVTRQRRVEKAVEMVLAGETR